LPSELSDHEIVRIASLPEDLNEDGLVNACDSIEVCAKTNTVYRYSSRWSKATIDYLKEFASATGAKIEAIDHQSSSIQNHAAVTKGMTKTASVVSPEVKAAQELLGDPFAYHEPVKASDIKMDKIMLGASAVINHSGGEDMIGTERHTPAIPGQNSLLNPNAIKQLAESKSDDNGVRLRAEAKARSENYSKQQKLADQERVAEAEKSAEEVPGSISKGSVILAGSDNIASLHTGRLYQKEDLPDLTPGEELRLKNQQRKASIQRPKQQREYGDGTEARRTISGDFAEALKKALGD
jgi:hypothetical protein